MSRILKRENLVWLFIAAHLAIALPLAWQLNLWLDEAWSLKTTADFSRIWTRAVFGERQAPVYFFLLGAWRAVGDSLFVARLFSIFCAAAAIFVFDCLAKRILPENYNSYATAFFAVHPFLIFVALEVRVYALAVLLSALLLLFWHRGFVGGDNRRARLWHVFLSVFAVYTYYYLGFLLVANAAALVVLHRWKSLQSYLLQMAVVAAGIVPLLFVIRLQFSVNAGYVRPDSSVIEGVRLVWQHFLNFVFPAEWQPSAIFRLWLVRIAVAILIFVLIKNKRGVLSAKTISLGAITAVCAAFFFVVYYLLGAVYLEIRHVAPLFVPATLFAASLLFDAARGRRRLVLIAVLLAFFYAASLAADYAPLAKRGDWARIAQFIEANEAASEPIVVFRIYDELPLSFYYRGKNEIVLKGAPHEPFGAENAPKSAERWRRQIETIIGAIPADHRRLWLVTEETCDDAKTMIECQPLEDFVQENYVVERTEFFYTRKLRLLRRK